MFRFQYNLLEVPFLETFSFCNVFFCSNKFVHRNQSFVFLYSWGKIEGLFITKSHRYMCHNNLPKNAKNSVLETLRINNFLGGMPPNPPSGLASSALAVSPPPVPSTWRRPLMNIKMQNGISLSEQKIVVNHNSSKLYGLNDGYS